MRAVARAVLFDLDNTLILEDEATVAAVRAAAACVGGRRAVSADAVVQAVADRADLLWRASALFAYGEAFGIWWGELLWGGFDGDGEALRALRAFLPGYRRAVWREALGLVGIRDDTLAREMERAYVAARRGGEHLDPEAASVLADLGRDHRLALVTNGAGAVQREKLSRTPFADAFDAVIVSAEAGAGKPDPRIFHAALDALGVSAMDATMVGDSLRRDVAGAHAAGIASIWIDRRLWDESGVVPDARIERLSELRAALDALERRRASPPASV